MIDKDIEYTLVIILTKEDGQEVRYFTRVLWSENTHALEKLSFIKDFHTKIFQKDEATELIKYLESNATGDNTSFHKVNIHSSFSQVTWGDLNVTEVGDTRSEERRVGKEC